MGLGLRVGVRVGVRGSIRSWGWRWPDLRDDVLQRYLAVISHHIEADALVLVPLGQHAAPGQPLAQEDVEIARAARLGAG